VPLVVTSLPVQTETSDAAASGDPAKPARLPATICGRLSARGDSDGYCFAAKRDETYAFEVVARRAGSECDPVLRLLDAKGAVLAEADDTRGMGKDSRIEWKATTDGVYVIQVSDLHDRGGTDFGYALLAEAARPDFVLTCDPDMINVGPGGRVPVFVRVVRRHGFAGAVSLAWEGLPQGVTASPLVINPAMTEGVIVVSAPEKIMRAAALVSLKGISEAAQGRLERQVTPTAEIYIPGGGRGHHPVETFGLAVTDPSDITVDTAQREVILAPGETATLDVTVTRSPRFTQPVNLAIALQHLGRVHGNPLPPGVTLKQAGSKTLLSPNEKKGKIILQAGPGAPACNKVPIAVVGHVSINFVVKTAYASAPVLVTVRPKGK
jgi:hypothetical protein